MNLYDILLSRCICSNKSEESVVATPLEVTENGEYEAAEGYAYNPVTVNVSCDFSTATIHIVNNTGSAVRGYCPLVSVIDGVTYTVTDIYTEEEEQDYTVILYGNNGAFLTFTSDVLTYATSGNIERADPDFPDFIVTGDCTVTVSQE